MFPIPAAPSPLEWLKVLLQLVGQCGVETEKLGDELLASLVYRKPKFKYSYPDCTFFGILLDLLRCFPHLTWKKPCQSVYDNTISSFETPNLREKYPSLNQTVHEQCPSLLSLLLCGATYRSIQRGHDVPFEFVRSYCNICPRLWDVLNPTTHGFEATTPLHLACGGHGDKTVEFLAILSPDSLDREDCSGALPFQVALQEKSPDRSIFTWDLLLGPELGPEFEVLEVRDIFARVGPWRIQSLKYMEVMPGLPALQSIHFRIREGEVLPRSSLLTDSVLDLLDYAPRLEQLHVYGQRLDLPRLWGVLQDNQCLRSFRNLAGMFSKMTKAEKEGCLALLKEHNLTLTDCYLGYDDGEDEIQYYLELNHFGRAVVRGDGATKDQLLKLLCATWDDLVDFIFDRATEDENDAAIQSVVYGLLREAPSLWQHRG